MSTKIEDILRDIRVSLNEVYEDGYKVGKVDQEIEDIEKIIEACDKGQKRGTPGANMLDIEKVKGRLKR